MKYYILRHNGLNIKETGTQFQSISGFAGDIQKDLIPFEGKINFAFKLPEPLLQNGAKPTTYLNVTFIPNWFLVLKRYFIDFLHNFKIEGFQTWDLKVHHKKNILNDYCLFILTQTHQNDLIDFSKSEFCIGDFFDCNFISETLYINDYENFLHIRNELDNKNKFLKDIKIVLNLSKIDLDLFRIINAPASGYYVSEKLKNAIEKERFTGFAFQEIEDMDDRIKVIF